MADIIVAAIEGTVWLVDEVLLALISFVEGFVTVLSHLPAVIENTFFLMELLVKGVLNSTQLIITSLWYTITFLINLPLNLGNLFLEVCSGIATCLDWILTATYLVISSIALVCMNIFEEFWCLLYLIWNGTFHISTNSLALISTAQSVCFSLVTTMINLFLYSVSVVYNLLLQFISSLAFLFLTIPHVCITKFSSIVWAIASGFKKQTIFHQDTIPYPTVGWLARFSQLMLVFAFIICVAVFLVILYHMRFKIFATLVALLNMFMTLMSGMPALPRQEERAADRPVQDGPGLRGQGPIEEHDREDDDTDDEGDNLGGGDEQNYVRVVRPIPAAAPRASNLRRSSSRREAPPQESSLRNYELLFRQEKDRQLCVVCQDNEKNTIIFPCKHLCACDTCIDHITNSPVLDRRRCPLCRGKISSYMDVFT